MITLQTIFFVFTDIQNFSTSWCPNIVIFQLQSGILNHYGSLPEAEVDYWKLPNGPAWGWWILTILPLDSQLQVSYSLNMAFK